MGKKGMEKRVHTREFKAVALAEKREKPISQVAKDFGINKNVLYRWMREIRMAEFGVQAFLIHEYRLSYFSG